MLDPPLVRQIAERLAARAFGTVWKDPYAYPDTLKLGADAIASDEGFKALVAAANEKCWSCGKPMRHDDECLCYGCGHYVCIRCCEKEGHLKDGAHGQSLAAKGAEDGR